MWRQSPVPCMRFLRRLRRAGRVAVLNEHNMPNLCCGNHTALHAHKNW